MARNIRRHVLAAKDSGVAGPETENETSSWRKNFDDPDTWIEQGSRWRSQSSKTARAAGDYGNSFVHQGADVERATNAEIESPVTQSTWQGSGLGKSLLFGLAGGLAATFVMTQAQTAWLKVDKGDEAEKPKSKEEQQKEVGEQSTVKIADKVAQTVTHHAVPQEYKQTAGNTVHYAFGTAMGGVYGALSGLMEDAPFGTGVLFGMGLWLAADEFVLPYLGLAQRPQEKDLKEHAYEASMHAVYGLCLDGVNQLRKKIA